MSSSRKRSNNEGTTLGTPHRRDISSPDLIQGASPPLFHQGPCCGYQWNQPRPAEVRSALNLRPLGYPTVSQENMARLGRPAPAPCPKSRLREGPQSPARAKCHSAPMSSNQGGRQSLERDIPPSVLRSPISREEESMLEGPGHSCLLRSSCEAKSEGQVNPHLIHTLMWGQPAFSKASCQ